MIQKQKICAGWDGNSHPAFLWKRINGKGYCKDCTFRLQPPKVLVKRTENQKEKIEIQRQETDKQFRFFLEIWEERKIGGRNYCEVTGEILQLQPLSIYFDHLLEKSSYPQFRFDKRNIAIVNGNVHALKTNGFPLPKHKELIEEAKRKLL
jgi:hypothetical protein